MSHKDVKEENFDWNDYPILQALKGKQDLRVDEYWASENKLQVFNQIDGQEFKTPDGFFDELQTAVFEETSKSSKTRIVPMRKWFIGLAAACLAGAIIWNAVPEQETCETFACLLEKTDLQAEDIATLYELDGSPEELYLETNEMTVDEEVLDYLIDSDIDTEELWELEY